jgi:hypothetical protein
MANDGYGQFQMGRWNKGFIEFTGQTGFVRAFPDTEEVASSILAPPTIKNSDSIYVSRLEPNRAFAYGQA